MTPDEEAVLAVHHGWNEANKTGDIDWLRENLAPDFFMHNSNGSVYRGREHVIRLWEFYRTRFVGWGLVPGPPVVRETRDHVIRVVGDLAWVAYRTRFAGRSVGEDYGGEFDVQSRGTDVMQRVQGRWLMAHGHYSLGEPGGPAGGL